MATDTTSLTTPAQIKPVDFAQLLASLTADALNRGQNTTTPANALVQPVAVTPAVNSSTAGGSVVNPNANLPPPVLPGGGAISPTQRQAAPLGDTSFTDQILAQNQTMPIMKPQRSAGAAKTGNAIDAFQHLADNGASIAKFIAAL